MAAAESNPYDKTPAEEFSYEALGADASGFVLEDETTDQFGNDIAPLQDGKQPYSAMFNRALECVALADLMTPTLRVTVRFNAGAPEVDSFRCKRTTLQTEDIVFVDNGAGDIIVRVVSNKLPPKRGEPGVHVHAGTKPTYQVAHYAATDTGVDYRGASVKLWDNGSAADLLHTVEIW